MAALTINKSIIFFLLCYELVGCKQFIPRDSSKLSECRRCKIVTDSFNYWLDKTSRGKFEGGDAIWEETKLKSYSRSEIRLVEVQESLCSEVKTHKDSCYSMAEEIEQVLESWWFNEDPQSNDLFTWLCIDNLKQCCPKNHFGETCNSCPLNKNKVCSGYGKCDGDGTRKGNGTCICKTGYTGILCEACDENFYLSDKGSCESCHKSCHGCSSEGANSCNACRPGWELKSGMCVDIDECTLSTCKHSEYCINSDGSYTCKECDHTCNSCIGEGPNNCISCESSNVLWFGSCIDNEQKENILTTTFRRLALYVGLLVITLFIFRSSISIASVVIIVVAVFIYISERQLKFHTINVLLHLISVSN